MRKGGLLQKDYDALPRALKKGVTVGEQVCTEEVARYLLLDRFEGRDPIKEYGSPLVQEIADGEVDVLTLSVRVDHPCTLPQMRQMVSSERGERETEKKKRTPRRSHVTRGTSCRERVRCSGQM